MKHSKLNKVVVWGYPPFFHTHSFVHAAWVKTFKALGYETYWFHDNSYPEDFDYSNTLFISEGYADEKIPIVKNSIYCIHICRNPKKYLDKECRLIDIRHNVRFLQDFSYDYVMDKTILFKIDDVTYYEKNASDLALREKYRNNVSNYEALYMMWATDLLPHEFNYDDINIEKENKIYYIGSCWHSNRIEIELFKEECSKNNIEFILKDPWGGNPLSFEENKFLVQKSYMAPDLRGSQLNCDDSVVEKCNHLSTGFIPCRTFKNISYGQLGITNSWAVNDIFQGRIVYNENVNQLFYDAQQRLSDKDLVIEQMNFVKEKHTYVNRINSILAIL
jgi:hypothetical protein